MGCEGGIVFQLCCVYSIVIFYLILVYRSSFPLTMAEGEKPDPDLGRVVFGVTLGVSCAIAFFAFLKKFGNEFKLFFINLIS